MPRKRKAARRFARFAAPTNDERQVLEFGYVILNHQDPSDVRPDPQLERVWGANRDEFMAKADPGRRPWAWWRFDAREQQPATWWSEYERLEALGQITADERFRFEKSHFSTAPDVNMAAVVVANWRQQGYSEGVTRRQIEEREFRATWHVRQGQDAAAEFYRRTAAGLREMVAEK
jgi:hypothetical protein